MAAELVSSLPLRSSRRRLDPEQAAQLRQLVLELDGIGPDAAGRLVAAIDRETRPEGEWRFVLLDAERNSFVVTELLERSTRPQTAVKVWNRLQLHLRHDTNEIVATRDQLAREVGAHPNHVTNVLAELEAMGAVERRKVGRAVTLTLNARVATHATGMTRALLQQEAPELRRLPPRKERKAPRHGLRIVGGTAPAT
jgi:DNA-binding MarR family transcriptional regulator